jgi:hypothetical protein
MEDGTRVTVSLRDTMAFALTDPIAKVRASGTRSNQSRIGEVVRTCAGFRSAHPSKSRDTSAACVTEIGAAAARREPFPHGCADCQDLSVLVEYVMVLLANGKSRAQVPPEPNSSYRPRPHKHAVRSHDASAHREGCSRTMQPCIALLAKGAVDSTRAAHAQGRQSRPRATCDVAFTFTPRNTTVLPCFSRGTAVGRWFIT